MVLSTLYVEEGRVKNKWVNNFVHKPWQEYWHRKDNSTIIKNTLILVEDGARACVEIGHRIKSLPLQMKNKRAPYWSFYGLKWYRNCQTCLKDCKKVNFVCWFNFKLLGNSGNYLGNNAGKLQWRAVILKNILPNTFGIWEETNQAVFFGSMIGTMVPEEKVEEWLGNYRWFLALSGLWLEYTYRHSENVDNMLVMTECKDHNAIKCCTFWRNHTAAYENRKQGLVIQQVKAQQRVTCTEEIIASKSVEETDEPIKSCVSKQQSVLLTDNLIFFIADVNNCSDQATEKCK